MFQYFFLKSQNTSLNQTKLEFSFSFDLAFQLHLIFWVYTAHSHLQIPRILFITSKNKHILLANFYKLLCEAWKYPWFIKIMGIKTSKTPFYRKSRQEFILKPQKSPNSTTKTKNPTPTIDLEPIKIPAATPGTIVLSFP